VLARKGVLASNPDVQRMTSCQWLLEFESLAQKERYDVERQLEFFKLFRKQLVSMLGLNVVCKKEDLENDPDMYIPWVMLGGRREIVQEIFERMEKEKAIESVTQDEAFEKLSSAIASGEIGDMDPILDISGLNLDGIQKTLQKEDLERAGVKLVDSVEPTAHISFDRDKMLERARGGIRDIQAARQQVSEELENEKKQAQGLSVLFDDDA